MLLKILSLYNRRRLLFNAILSVLQVVILGGTYFIIYTILLRNLGAQKLGTWSVVLSTSSIANIANIGLSSSLVKYIAEYSNSIEDNSTKISNLIKTSTISIGIFVGIVCLFLYVIGYYLLEKALPITELDEARYLLPFSLVSLWISSLAGIFLSTLDGFHYSSLRSLIYIISSFAFIIIGWQLLPFWGLTGIAIAQTIQAFINLVLSFWGINFVFKYFKILPFKWDRETFNHIFKFSINFQIISLCQLLYDPVTKFFLAKYGGLSSVGYYEMASRLVIQIRTLIVSANQVIVPTVASNNTKNTDETYPKILNLVISITLPIFVAIVIFTPYISYYWIGEFEFHFMWFLLILTISWFSNIISTPSYFSSIGLGNLKGILYSHIFIAISNIILGWALGILFAGIGVIIGWGLSLILGSLITLDYYNRNYRINKKSIDYKQFIRILIPSLACLLVSFYYFDSIVVHQNPNFFLVKTIIVYLLYLVSIGAIIILFNKERINEVVKNYWYKV